MLICVVFVSLDMILEDKALISEVVLSQSIFICMILERHMTAFKRILRYFRSTLNFGLHFTDHPHLSFWSTLMLIGQDARYSPVHF
jgi:hypothetical protein